MSGCAKCPKYPQEYYILSEKLDRDHLMKFETDDPDGKIGTIRHKLEKNTNENKAMGKERV